MQIRGFNKQNEIELNQVFQIQIAAYTVEAQLLGAADFPPLHGTRKELFESNDESFLYFKGQQPIGAIFLEKKSEFILVSKLIVCPAFFRQGVASSLLAHCLNLYPESEFQVSTGIENNPALQLYRTFGFRIFEEYLFDGQFKLCKLQRNISSGINVDIDVFRN